MSHKEYEPAGPGYVRYLGEETDIPVYPWGQGSGGENALAAIEAPPAFITARIKPENLAEYFKTSTPYSALLGLYYTGWDYTALTQSIDYEIAHIISRNAGSKEGSSIRPQALWDDQTLDRIIAAENIDKLSADQKEFRLLWGLRVESAKLGLSFLNTLELPTEGLERRILRPIGRNIGEKGPHKVSPWGRSRAHQAEEEVIKICDTDLQQNDSMEAKRILQLQTVRLTRSFNALIDYYAQPPAKFSQHMDPTYDRNSCFYIDGSYYAANINLKPGEFWRASLLGDITRQFHLWDQCYQIEKDLGSPKERPSL